MAKCDYCELAEKSEKIFEDEKAFAVLAQNPASLGHILVISKEHFTILEQVPDFLAGRLFSIANEISTKIFETMRVHGTNLIVQNGLAASQKIPHFAINIIPRAENDGLGFNWQPIQVSDDDMSTVELQLKEETGKIGGFEKSEKKAIEINDEKKVISSSEDDYLLRQLRRIP